MHTKQRSAALTAAVLISAISGLALAAAGAWLAWLGGSWYYLLAGLAFLATSVLLYRRDARALWAYAALVLGSLLWSLWEAGLDWWPLAARMDVLFLFGVFLLTPWVTRPLVHRKRATPQARAQYAPALRRASLPLALAMVLFVAAAIASWFVDVHRIEGELPAAGAAIAAGAGGVPPGAWYAYGRTAEGQRYSPLTQINPKNVGKLEVAWHYETGDERGHEGDPVETTFEATPLKIGNRLFFCTPHQSVIALDATTGKQVWRYDPKIQSGLALQHLTCRGLSFRPAAKDRAGGPATETARKVAAAIARAPEAAPQPSRPDLPIAAQIGPAVDACDAMLFMPTADGRIIALNPDSGAVCKNFGAGTGQLDLWRNMPNVNPGSYYSTSPVAVSRSLIIVGGTVLDNVSTAEASGVIRAYDIDSGKLIWNWDAGKPDATEPISADASYTANSPNSWSISSLDEELGMVYVPLGNQPPDQWGGDRSAAVERYGSAIVALDLASGRVRWSFQTVHHDLWDYDIPAQPSLIDLTVNGETVPALVQPTKQGEVFVLDRRNGKPILPVSDVPAPQGAAQGDRTAAAQPMSQLSYAPQRLTGADMWGATLFDQLACRIAFRQLRYEGRYTPPSTQGTLVYPGNFGVFNWGSIAVDPQRQVAFTTPTYLAFVSRLVPRKDDTSLYVQGGNRPKDSLPALNENFGAPFAVQLSAFTSALGLPCQAPPWGYVAGADLKTGKIAWMHKNGTVRDSSPLPLPFKMGVPNLGGPILTGAGLAFLSGTLDYYVRAYDVADGRQLWESRLPAGGQATPMTYMGEDGRQYLVVVAGGHGSLGTKAGDDVIAYALPKE